MIHSLNGGIRGLNLSEMIEMTVRGDQGEREDMLPPTREGRLGKQAPSLCIMQCIVPDVPQLALGCNRNYTDNFEGLEFLVHLVRYYTQCIPESSYGRTYAGENT